MASKKISISLPASQIRFIEQYQNNKQYKSRSQVIEEALQLLQEKELEAAYHLASQEIDSDWDVTIADGLSDETW